jgi:hypothetical protein
MAIAVTGIEELGDYVQGVMARADHHAGAVKHIALALAGAIVWKKAGDKPIKVAVGRDGATRNVLWVRMGGKRYAFSYNIDSGTIEMREGSTGGSTLHSFTNTTPLSDIYAIFEGL